jgi:hypothetical protein
LRLSLLVAKKNGLCGPFFLRFFAGYGPRRRRFMNEK